MKIAVIGPGALGCLLAAFFQEAGEEVWLVDYRPERVETLRQQGIELTTLEGRRQVVKIPIALAGEVGAADLTLMTVKAHQTAAAASGLPHFMGQGGLALTLQNGLGNLEAMAQVAGPERLLVGVIFAGATRPRDGQVIYAGLGATYVGAPPGSQVGEGEIAQVVDLFHRAGLQCQARPDIEAMVWEKLLVNVGINPLTALLRVPNGALLKIPQAWDMAAAAAREAAEVARASGLAVTADPDALLRQVCIATAANSSSMLQDVLAGRPTEITALNAQVVARGKAHGLATPVNACLTRLIQALEAAPRLRGGPGERSSPALPSNSPPNPH